MNLIIDSRTIYNKYSRNNKINDYPITTNYTINYFNHYYPFNVYIYRDINHFISLFCNFFEVGNFDPPADRNGGDYNHQFYRYEDSDHVKVNVNVKVKVNVKH